MDDAFSTSLQELDEARTGLLAALSVLDGVLSNGNGHTETLTRLEMDGTRTGILGALSRFSRAFAVCRSQAIKAMVEQEGRTLTDVARLTGHSRQRISELYRHSVKV